MEIRLIPNAFSVIIRDEKVRLQENTVLTILWNWDRPSFYHNIDGKDRFLAFPYPIFTFAVFLKNSGRNSLCFHTGTRGKGNGAGRMTSGLW